MRCPRNKNEIVQEVRLLKAFKELSAHLLTMVAEAWTVQAALDKAALLLGNPLVIGSPDLVVHYVSSDMPEDSPNAKIGPIFAYNEEVIYRSVRSVEDITKLGGSKYFPKSVNRYRVVLSTIEYLGQSIGYLVITCSNRPFEESDLEAGKHIARAMSMLLRINGDKNFYPTDDIDMSFRSILLSDGNPNINLKILEKEFREKQQKALTVVVCEYAERQKASAPPKPAREELCKLLGARYFLSIPGQLIVLTYSRLTELRDEITAILQKYHLVAGISFPFYTISHTRCRYLQACQVCSSATVENRLLFYFNWIIDDMFEGYDFMNFCHPAAKKLFNYDKMNGTFLRKTAITYLSYQQNIKATSEFLGVHVNTVKQRLNQINSLLQEFSFCYDSLFVLYICLMQIGHENGLG